eukprot:TRINITY_DN4519_c0_g1_i1.p1 TRINITY_DN4519_c0_g1~~TRINITY_DN4519_c0_g1_i1.p1  ORF type:complete len:254 (+),score=74.16 TRINITY_DN4519_c0_g1_i1:470-1231(+)
MTTTESAVDTHLTAAIDKLDINNDSSDNEQDNNNIDDDDDDTYTTTTTTTSASQNSGEEEEDVEPSDLPVNNFQKHPLQNAWCLWYDNPMKRVSPSAWADQLKKITTFDTVEDFWRVYNHLKPASALASGANYHLFKDGVAPKWEDPQNERGGCWVISLKGKKSSLDQTWLYAILSLIGETTDAPDEVCGIVVSLRKAGDRIQLWTKDASNESAVKALGRSFKAAIEYEGNIGYTVHNDAKKSSKSVKSRYEV